MMAKEAAEVKNIIIPPSHLDLAGPPPALSVDELQGDWLAVLLAPATSPLLGIPPSGSPDLLRPGF